MTEVDIMVSLTAEGVVPGAALCADFHGNFIAVGDAIKAACVFMYSDHLTLIAQSPISMFTTAIKMLSADEVIVTDMFKNLVILQRSHNRMIIQSSIYFGDQISNIQSGSLSKYPSDLDILDSFIFSTAQGSLGVLIELDEALYKKLEVLQFIMSQNCTQVGNLPLEEYRTRKNELREAKDWKYILDGDFLEQFLEMPLETQIMVTNRVELELEWVVQALQALNKLH